MKSVLIICNSLNTGGAEKQTVSLANGLYRRGWKVVFVYLVASDNLLREIDAGLREHVYYVPRKKYIDWTAVSSIKKLLKGHGIFLVLAVNRLALVYAVMSTAFEKKVKLLAGIHTTKLSGIDALAFYFSFWWLYKFARQVIYVCRTQMDYWSVRGLHLKRRATYIYNGVDTKKYLVASDECRADMRKKLQIPESSAVFVSIAMLRREKRHVDMVRALMKVIANGGDAYLLCVGDGEEKERILRLAEELDIRKYVRMTGRVDDVRPYLAAADVTLLLSASETFSIAVLESMSCGCPVIAYDVGGVREQIISQDCGAVLTPGDSEALVELLMNITAKRVAADKQALHEFVCARFSDEMMVARYEELFETQMLS